MRKQIEWNGETHTIAEWSQITGISKKTLQWRFSKGWDAEKALTYVKPRKRATSPEKLSKDIQAWTKTLQWWHGLVSWPVPGARE